MFIYQALVLDHQEKKKQVSMEIIREYMRVRPLEIWVTRPACQLHLVLVH